MKNLELKKNFPVLLGTIVEYYDYGLYGFSALMIANMFFPSSEPSIALITTYGVFAIGSCAKPLGAIIFGWIGDNFGRKVALNVTILGIAFPTFIIGCLPSYEHIGFLAPIILVMCRFFQGIFVAGEYDGAALYVLEHAKFKKKASGASFVRATGVTGLLFGSCMVALCSLKGMPDWAWRIPFMLSLLLGGIALFFRNKLTETPEFISYLEHEKKDKTPFVVALKRYWRDIGLVIILTGCAGGIYQISIFFLHAFLPKVLPETGLDIPLMSPFLLLVFGLSMPIAGIIADRRTIIGVMHTGILIALIASLGMITSLVYHSPIINRVAYTFLVIGLAPFNALSHALIYRFFGVNHRYRCVVAGHTLGSMLLSGSAPFICSLLWKTTGLSFIPLIYIATLLTIGYGTLLICKKRVEAQEALSPLRLAA